eukprot:scaffold120814_cov112-Phaeocystis_antarctica.AAC.1
MQLVALKVCRVSGLPWDSPVTCDIRARPSTCPGSDPINLSCHEAPSRTLAGVGAGTRELPSVWV